MRGPPGDGRATALRGRMHEGLVRLQRHWHHARFDLESGCTLWADDAPTFPVEMRNDEVWVKATSVHGDPASHWRQRLDDGLAHDIGLVIAKAVYAARGRRAFARLQSGDRSAPLPLP